ncbi:hypothetical protein FACS189426_04820 [Bacteroidia bacterium]|nr:hypothetical protein FACS189426_04820 [Bacteroidia bacterium]
MQKETQHIEFKTKTQPSIIPDVEVIEYEGVEIVEFRIQE